MLPTILEVMARLREDDPPLDLSNEVEFEWVTWGGAARIVPTECLSFARNRETFLYRGQTKRYHPCYSSLLRGAPPEPTDRVLPGSDETKFRCRVMLSRIRVAELELVLRHHPFTRLAKERGLFIDHEALAQHYGIATNHLDLTSSIAVAAFFAVARWNASSNEFEPMDHGAGVLYRVRWLRCGEASGYFVPVGHGPATRPGVQHAFSFQLRRGIDFEQVPQVESIEFRHDSSASREIMFQFDQGRLIYPAECVVEVVRKIRDLPFATMDAIKHAISRDVTDAERVKELAEKTAVTISSELNLDVIDGHNLELETEDIQRAEQEVVALDQSMGPRAGFRMVRTRKPSI